MSRRFFKSYQRALCRMPYMVQAVQTATLMGTGDIISQTVVEKKSLKNVEFNRTLRFSSIGFFIGGPALRFWYGQLHKRLGSTGKSVAVKKVVVDQFVFAPLFLLMFLTAVGVTQGKTWNHIQSDIQSNYLDILKNNYLLWPWVQLINFYYVPLHYQVLTVQAVALFWNTYLSWKTNRTSKTL